jgi:hypothetical protein
MRRTRGTAHFLRMLARLFFVCFCLAVSVATPGEVPVQVTTDTAAYCARLARRMALTPQPSAQATRLAAEGRALCVRGDVRDGIRRLRQALLLSRPATAGR